jgi:serine/threonine protein kinase
MNLPLSDTQPDPIDLTGRQLGDYLLLRRLGRGGMADVYLAKQGSLNRNIALKILKPDLARDDSYVQRFRQEAQAAANLVQANIVQIYEVGECDGFYFIAQEYIQGRNLRQYLLRHGAVEPVMAINVIRQCAMALQKAGELHVIHRDIKPENVMLSTKGEVKITDFGLARINNSAAQQALTQIGITMGTPLYMSPEQVEGGPVDQRSDIYSLGVTAYHMLAGTPPFDGDNALAIAVQHVKDKPVPIGQMRPDVPPELSNVIDWMMAKRPSDRPDDAKQLLKELRKIKIDIEDDWEMIVEKLSTSETHSIENVSTWSQSKLAATRQLQSVMKGHVRTWWKLPGTILTLSLLSIAALLGGWFWATQTAPGNLLNVDQISVSEVPRMKTVEEQYREARTAGYRYGPEIQKQYWIAVAEYHPPDKAPKNEEFRTQMVVRLSKARLAEFCLSNDEPLLQEALDIYDEFVSYDELDREFRIYGFAGRAIVYDQMDAEAFAGGEAEKLDRIRAAIGEVGDDLEPLNEFMLKRFLDVKERLDENIERPDDLNDLIDPQDSSGGSSRLWRLFRLSQVS